MVTEIDVKTKQDEPALALDPSVKVVVLVDGGTASAAEIVAGALQTRGRAKLVGQTTYGKGVVQEWLPLPNNQGGIHLTIARWLLPEQGLDPGQGAQPGHLGVDGRSASRYGSDPRRGPRRRSDTRPSRPSPSPQPRAPRRPGPRADPVASRRPGARLRALHASHTMCASERR